jgi:hypothetical protein
MSTEVAQRNIVHTAAATKRSNQFVRNAVRVSAATRALLTTHDHKRETDPAYREAWDHLICLITNKKGPVGEHAQLIEALQTFLAKAMR